MGLLSGVPYGNEVGKVFNKRDAQPTQIIHYVTNKCNAKCNHCFFWKELNVKLNELTVDEIQRFTQSMDDFSYLIMTGGEPFLRKDVADIARAYYDNCSVKNMVMPTNGIMKQNTVDSVTRMLEECPNAAVVVDFSFDGIREQHDEIRGVKCFDKSVETLNALKEVQRNYPRLSLGSIITYTSFNQDNMKEVYEYIRDVIKPDHTTMNYIRGSPKDPNTKHVDVDRYVEVCKEMEGDILSGKMKGVDGFLLADVAKVTNVLIREHIARTVKTNRYYTPCYAGILNAVIYSNGDVFPCEILSQKIGNIREANYDFKGLWASERAKEVRKFIRDTNCFCTHECFYYTNILMNPAFAPKVLGKVAEMKVKRLVNRFKAN